jgi:hypothetical protein
LENPQEAGFQNEKESTQMNPVTEMKTNPNPAPESDCVPSTQCIQDNLRMMHAYFDALFTKVHTKDLHMELTNMFTGDEQMCIEYLHRGIMPERSTITGSPAVGTKIAVPICLTLHIKDGKFDKVDEYLDLATLSGVKQHLFSDTGGGPTSCAYSGTPMEKIAKCFSTYTFSHNALIATPQAFPPSSWPAGNPQRVDTEAAIAYAFGGAASKRWGMMFLFREALSS